MFGPPGQARPSAYYGNGVPNPLLATTTTAKQNPLVYNQTQNPNQQQQARFHVQSSQQPFSLPNAVSNGSALPNTSATINSSNPVRLPQAAAESKPTWFCAICNLPHNANQPCPVFKSEIQIRLAIDSLREAATKPASMMSNPTYYQMAMASLQQKLRALRNPAEAKKW